MEAAEEIIFFDDVIENINAANSFGLKAHQVLNPSQAKAILNQYKLL
jgi:methionine salvage enolase-phosphatase E1